MVRIMGQQELDRQKLTITEAGLSRGFLSNASLELMDHYGKVITTEIHPNTEIIQALVHSIIQNSGNSSGKIVQKITIGGIDYNISLNQNQFNKLHKLLIVYESLKDYVEKYELSAFQAEFNKLAPYLEEIGVDLLIALDGRDTAGKGGVIDRLNFRFNRRKFKNIAPGIPTESEKKMDYFERYLSMLGDIISKLRFTGKGKNISFDHLGKGRVITYDRSWYNYMYIGKVLGFCSDEQYKDYLSRVLPFESNLMDKKFNLFKFYLSITEETQNARLFGRLIDPLKSHKVSQTDFEAHKKFKLFTPIKEDIFLRASTDENPIFSVDFNDRHLGRLALLYSILSKYLGEYENSLDLANEIKVVNPSLAIPGHKIKKETV